MLRVGMQFRTLRVLLRRRVSRKAFPREALGTMDVRARPTTIVPTLRVGMQFRTLCVLCDAEHEQRWM
ncbi:hypothetical protein AL047_13425 [Pseudomonas syringae pv. broussonetiae]|nr:hypothetical protein AL047_13425 [Pseudomonas syringae pv. broussonetiae]